MANRPGRSQGLDPDVVLLDIALPGMAGSRSPNSWRRRILIALAWYSRQPDAASYRTRLATSLLGFHSQE
jgi:hypothetical protein